MKGFLKNILFSLFLIGIFFHQANSAEKNENYLLNTYKEIISKLKDNESKIQYNKQVVDRLKDRLRRAGTTLEFMNVEGMAKVSKSSFDRVYIDSTELEQIVLAQVENGGDEFVYNGKNDAVLFYYDSPTLQRSVPITIYSLFVPSLSMFDIYKKEESILTQSSAIDRRLLDYKEKFENLLNKLKSVDPKKLEPEKKDFFKDFGRAVEERDENKIRALCANLKH